MKDLIDEKNRRDKIKSSIIKRWNVNYIDPETLRLQEEQKRKLEAQEVLNRLEAEKAADEALKREEIERAYQEAAEKSAQNYNAATNSYSGAYGKGNVDDVTQNQIEMILHEKDKKLRNIIDQEKK